MEEESVLSVPSQKEERFENPGMFIQSVTHTFHCNARFVGKFVTPCCSYKLLKN